MKSAVAAIIRDDASGILLDSGIYTLYRRVHSEFFAAMVKNLADAPKPAANGSSSQRELLKSA